MRDYCTNNLGFLFFHIVLLWEESNVLLNNIPNNIERIRTIKLQQFIVSLCKKFNCYLIVYNKKRQIFEYQKVISKEQIKASHSMAPSRVKLVIPSLKAVYFDGWDFTHFLYYQKRKKLSRFEHLIKRKGLYII